jgi:cytohesin
MLAAARHDIARVRSLLAHKTPADAMIEGRTALMVAAAYGDPRVVRQLLAAGAHVDRRDSQGQTALFYAIRNGRRQAVEVLLAASADPNVASALSPVDVDDGRTPLTLTLMSRRVSVASANWMASSTRALRERKAAGDFIGYSLAREQYTDGDWEGILEALLAKGADPNRKDANGDNALLMALLEHDTALADRLRRAGAKEELLYEGLDPSQYLVRAARLCDVGRTGRSLKAGADPNAEDALSGSLGCADLAVARLLLDRGADPKRPSRLGYSAFTSAALSRGAEAVKLLLDRGMDPNSAVAPSAWEQGHPKDAHGYDTALILAMGNKDPEVVRLLLAAGADPNRRGRRGTTALFEAVHRNGIDAAKLLLAHGADPNLRPAEESPLLTAVNLGEIEMAKLLLAHKADVNAPAAKDDGTGSRETPLMSAAYLGNPEMVRLLLAAGADPGALDAFRHTALDAARSHAKLRDGKEIREVVELLQKADRNDTQSGGKGKE